MSSLLDQHSESLTFSEEDSEPVISRSYLKRKRQPFAGPSPTTSVLQKRSPRPHSKVRTQSPGLTCLPGPPEFYPPSLRVNYAVESQVPIISESNLIGLFYQHPAQFQSLYAGQPFLAIEANNFSVYRPAALSGPQLPNELRGLQDLLNPDNPNRFLVDIDVSINGRSYTLLRLQIDTLSIETGQFPNNRVWIQTRTLKKHNLWLQLGQPSQAYRPLSAGFEWLAQLVDFICMFLDGSSAVTLLDFKSRFWTWLMGTFGMMLELLEWKVIHPRNDFRRVVAANIKFLWRHVCDLGPDYELHPFWREVWPGVPSSLGPCIPLQPLIEQRTITTPFVHRCFSSFSFSDHLKSIESQWTTSFGGSVAPHWQKRLRSLPQIISQTRRAEYTRSSLSSTSSIPALHDLNAAHRRAYPSGLDKPLVDVKVGDVVKLQPDSADITKWKDGEEFWYVFVQAIERDNASAEARLRVIWLYSPSATSCGIADYPFANELFLSDHCNCDLDLIPISEVLEVVEVLWGPVLNRVPSTIFIRQRFSPKKSEFCTLKPSHLKCDCLSQEVGVKYSKGDTVLIKMKGNPLLEPVELLENVDAKEMTTCTVRELRRARIEDQDAAINELYTTPNVNAIDVKSIRRRCHIKVFPNRQAVEMPYSRGGIGDSFYILGDSHLDCTFIQSTGSNEPTFPKLVGLDLFCGGGNFARGFKESGAVKFRWAVDLNENAIHTYRANLDDADLVDLFHGSVNDYLSKAMREEFSSLIARPGEASFILAGSPCQGFALMNQSKNNEQSEINKSMIASALAYIDFYRPDYAVLENVVNMTTIYDKRQNVFGGVIATLVGMGYQTAVHTIGAWSFGAPQSRNRLFICIAAPGLKPLQRPLATHSDTPSASNRSQGKLANGLTFGDRVDFTAAEAPFPFVSLREATKDLPVNYFGRGFHPSFPDHTQSATLAAGTVALVSHIPKGSNSWSFSKAWRAGLIPDHFITDGAFFRSDQRLSERDSAYTRNSPKDLMPTITTVCTYKDSFTGKWLHWEADRTLTVLAARRGQQYTDDDIILGDLAQQWKIVGNSVARGVSLALGLELRAACESNNRTIVSFPQSQASTEHNISETERSMAHSVLE